MGSYRKGARFENRVKKHLEQEGWYVMRSAGSHGPADLIACKPAEIRLIACRTEKARYSASEAKQLGHLAQQLAFLGNRVRAYLAYREPKPPWTIRLEKIELEVQVWKPDEEKLPPWYEDVIPESHDLHIIHLAEEKVVKRVCGNCKGQGGWDPTGLPLRWCFQGEGWCDPYHQCDKFLAKEIADAEPE